jgi:hypothetical protein
MKNRNPYVVLQKIITDRRLVQIGCTFNTTAPVICIVEDQTVYFWQDDSTQFVFALYTTFDGDDEPRLHQDEFQRTVTDKLEALFPNFLDGVTYNISKWESEEHIIEDLISFINDRRQDRLRRR